MHIFAVQGESDKESYLCKRCYRTAVAGAAMEHSNSLRLIGATWSQCSVSRVCEASLCGRIPDAGLYCRDHEVRCLGKEIGYSTHFNK